MTGAVTGAVTGGSTPRRLVLVRHGQTAWNLEGRAQGHTDVCLDDTGREQAAAMAPVVALLRPARLWTSDLARARETAAFLADATGLQARPDPRLREFDVGARSGLTVAEFAARFPQEHALWAAGNATIHVPGAETDADVLARMVPCLEELWDLTAPGETSVAVAHGAALKLCVLALAGLPAEAARSFRGLENCGWVVLEPAPHDAGLRISSYNETAHPAVHGPDFATDAPIG